MAMPTGGLIGGMILVYNAFVVAVMAVLAYRMDRWWIVLFAALLMMRGEIVDE